MLFMTAKLDRSKILIILGAVAMAILGIILLFGGGAEPTATTANLSTNDARVDYLKNLGWEVHAAPAESGQVRIPKESSEVYDRYNDLQKAQGFDLTNYAGKTVARYVYKVTNYPGATEPVYATLLIYKNKVIGGDIINTAPTGAIQGLQKAPSE